jgi:Hemopexin
MARVRTAFFFRGGKYVRYEVDPNTGVETVNLGVYPRDISDGWAAMPASFTTALNAAVAWHDGFVYFFKGPKYVRWDATNDTVDAQIYPRDISDGWPALPASFQGGVDAAINWGDDRMFFFKGPKYVRYDVDPNTGAETVNTAIYPRDISDGWPDFPASFAAGVDAAVNWGNGTAYFFKQAQYLSYDIAQDKVNAGYPLPITEPGKWPALVAAGFAGPFDEVIEWPQADVNSETIPANLSSCVAITQPRVRCGREWAMKALFTDANPSVPACGEYRQFVRGTFELNGSTVPFILQEHGAPAPIKLRPRPSPGAGDDNFREDGQPASRSPFGVDTHYGHRDAPYGNRNILDLYLPSRRSGAQYEGRDFAGMPQGPPGSFFKIDADFRGQLIDVCNGGAVLRSHEWTVTCSVP